ncbi:MAG: hypothetical protein MAG715_00665 [Methanonatronarchaeales archaeon]|nr:hypothetical protein [Methanonatronarchaeales archaeon]
MRGDIDETLFYTSSTLLLAAGVSLAVVKDSLLVLALGFSLPLFLLVVHLEVIPVFVLPFAAIFEGFRRSSRRLDGPIEEPPEAERFTAVVPVRNDESVLERCVESIREHRLAEVLIVYESDCVDSTATVARELSRLDGVEAVENPPEHAGSKAGALNFALKRVDTEIVAVFDADHEALPGDVEGALRRLAQEPDLAYLSGRTVKRDSGLLGKIGYGESLLFHQIPSYVMDRIIGIHMLTTTNCFFRRGEVEACGGFDTSVLTEDMELSVRLFLSGKRTRFDPSIVSVEDSARNARDWWGQKKRWIRGSIEVSRKNAHRPLLDKPGLRGLALSLFLLTIPFVYPITVVLSGYLLLTLFTGGTFALFPLLFPGVLVAYMARSDSGAGLSGGPSPAHLLSPFFLMLASFVGMRAICEEVAGTEAQWYRVSR